MTLERWAPRRESEARSKHRKLQGTAAFGNSKMPVVVGMKTANASAIWLPGEGDAALLGAGGEIHI